MEGTGAPHYNSICSTISIYPFLRTQLLVGQCLLDNNIIFNDITLDRYYLCRYSVMRPTTRRSAVTTVSALLACSCIYRYIFDLILFMLHEHRIGGRGDLFVQWAILISVHYYDQRRRYHITHRLYYKHRYVGLYLLQ